MKSLIAILLLSTFTDWQNYLEDRFDLRELFTDSKYLGEWREHSEFVISGSVTPDNIEVNEFRCHSDRLVPTHPAQSTKEYLHAAYAPYDHATLPPTSYACLIKNPTGKYCLRATYATVVVMSDTNEDDCGNTYRGYWLVTYLKSDETMETLFAKGRTVYPKPNSQFPGEFEEGSTYALKTSDFFLLGKIYSADAARIKAARERALSSGYIIKDGLFIR